MKKTLASTVLALLLVLAAFYVTGTRVEPVLQDSVAKLQARTPGLSLALKGKSGGIFASRYAYSFDYSLPDPRQEGSKHLSGELLVDVANGPLPLAAGLWTPCLAQAVTTFTLDGRCDPDIRAFFDTFPELASTTVITRLAFDTSAVLTLALPAFTRTVTDSAGVPTTFDWKGLKVECRSPAGYQSVKGTLAAPGLVVQAREAVMAFENLNLDFDSRSLSDKLWTGRQVLRLQSLAVKPANADAFILQGLEADASLTPRAEVVDYALALAGEYRRPGQPPLPARMSLAFRDLDMVALNELMDLLGRAPRARGDSPVTEQELRSVGNALLNRSPSLELNVTALEGEARLALSCEAHAEGMASLPAMALQALPFLRVKADFSGLEKSLVDLSCALTGAAARGVSQDQCLKGTAAQIEQFVANGLLLRQEGKLTAKAAWNGRSVVVNGKEMN